MASKRVRSEFDRIVIGAGPVGILSALCSHLRGFRVRVVDRSETVGGQWRALAKDGHLFENGLHFVHHPLRWNETLFDFNLEIPLSAPTETPLRATAKGLVPIDHLEGFNHSERPYLQPGLKLVSGTMGQWLEGLVQRFNLDVRLNTPVQEITFDEDHGVIQALTPKEELAAQAWVLTGAPEIYRTWLPPPVLRQHASAGVYRPALVLQMLLKRPVTDCRSVIVLEHRMDHVKRNFIGLFESNLDPTRTQNGRQSCTWMCFLEPEEFEDISAVSRWRRALKRDVLAQFEGMEPLVQWERFLALPEAGGPVPRHETLPKEIPSGPALRWKNALFLTHATGQESSPLLWTTQQLMALQLPDFKSAAEMPQHL